MRTIKKIIKSQITEACYETSTNTKRVFKGLIFEVYQWEQKMFDSSFQTFEMVKRPHTLEIIAIKDGKILMAKQEQPGMPGPIFTLFGGRAEKGESELAGQRRELLEEAGLESSENFINIVSEEHFWEMIWH